jgi:hypothetical protein
MQYYKDSKKQIHAFEKIPDTGVPSDFVAITLEDANKILEEENQKIIDNLSYFEKRKAEYPSMSEQLDLIYHNGIDAWKAEIKKIKDKYPKS